MVKIKVGNKFEIQANSTKDVLVLLDAIQKYEKMVDISPDVLLNCPVCGSFDIQSISPEICYCKICNTEFEMEWVKDDE